MPLGFVKLNKDKKNNEEKFIGDAYEEEFPSLEGNNKNSEIIRESNRRH